MVIAFLQNYCQGLAGVEAVSALLILLAGIYRTVPCRWQRKRAWKILLIVSACSVCI